MREGIMGAFCAYATSLRIRAGTLIFGPIENQMWSEFAFALHGDEATKNAASKGFFRLFLLVAKEDRRRAEQYARQMIKMTAGYESPFLGMLSEWLQQPQPEPARLAVMPDLFYPSVRPVSSPMLLLPMPLLSAPVPAS